MALVDFQNVRNLEKKNTLLIDLWTICFYVYNENKEYTRIVFVCTSVCMPFCLYALLLVCPSVCMPFCLYVLLFVCPSAGVSFCLYVLLFVCLLFVCPSVCMPLCLYVILFVCPSVCMPFCLYALLFVCPSVCMPFCLHAILFVCPSFYLNNHLTRSIISKYSVCLHYSLEANCSVTFPIRLSFVYVFKKEIC